MLLFREVFGEGNPVYIYREGIPRNYCNCIYKEQICSFQTTYKNSSLNILTRFVGSFIFRSRIDLNKWFDDFPHVFAFGIRQANIKIKGAAQRSVEDVLALNNQKLRQQSISWLRNNLNDLILEESPRPLEGNDKNMTKQKQHIQS